MSHSLRIQWGQKWQLNYSSKSRTDGNRKRNLCGWLLCKRKSSRVIWGFFSMLSSCGELKWNAIASTLLSPLPLLLLLSPLPSGEGGRATAANGLHGASRHRFLPGRWWDVARAERASGSTHGGHLDRSLCSLLDPFFPDRAGHPAVFVWHPARMEERFPLARLLQLFLQPAYLHGLQQKLQQRLPQPVLQAALKCGVGIGVHWGRYLQGKRGERWRGRERRKREQGTEKKNRDRGKER